MPLLCRLLWRASLPMLWVALRGSRPREPEVLQGTGRQARRTVSRLRRCPWLRRGRELWHRDRHRRVGRIWLRGRRGQPPWECPEACLPCRLPLQEAWRCWAGRGLRRCPEGGRWARVRCCRWSESWDSSSRSHWPLPWGRWGIPERKP